MFPPHRYGGAHGLLDPNVVRSALASPINRWAYDDAADLADRAAAYLVRFARTQGFNDGDRRTGLACALVFLRLNGYALHVPAKELYALVMQVATGDADDEVVGRVSENAPGARVAAAAPHVPVPRRPLFP